MIDKLFRGVERALGEITRAPLEAGAVAPDFTLKDQSGRSVRLYDLRGRPVVLVFYPRDHTPVCSGQLQDLDGMLEKLTAAGGLAFGVNPGSAKSHQDFQAALGLRFDLLVDEGGATARAWRATAGPKIRRTVYAVTPGGRIAFAERGRPDPERVIRALGLWDPPPTPADEGVPVSTLIQVQEPGEGGVR